MGERKGKREGKRQERGRERQGKRQGNRQGEREGGVKLATFYANCCVRISHFSSLAFSDWFNFGIGENFLVTMCRKGYAMSSQPADSLAHTLAISLGHDYAYQVVVYSAAESD